MTLVFLKIFCINAAAGRYGVSVIEAIFIDVLPRPQPYGWIFGQNPLTLADKLLVGE
jgi:hypothetical protein